MCSVPPSTKAPSASVWQSGEICQTFCTEAFTSLCQAYVRARYLDFPKHCCLLPPFATKDCTVVTSFSCAHVCLRDCLLDVSCHCALPLLSVVATGKPLTRWRLAPAQEVARVLLLLLRPPARTFELRCAFTESYSLRRISIQGLLTQGVLFFFAQPVFHTLCFSLLLATCIIFRGSIMCSGYACMRLNMTTSWNSSRQPLI